MKRSPPLHHGWGGQPLPPAKCPKPSLGCPSATGYGTSPRTFHGWLWLIPGCLKRSSPNLRSGKKDGREGGQESRPELHLLVGIKARLGPGPWGLQGDLAPCPVRFLPSTTPASHGTGEKSGGVWRGCSASQIWTF